MKREPLLLAEDVDRLLNLPPGRAHRLARTGRLPHLVLPDGSIRFRWGDVRARIRKGALRPRGDRIA